jgi:inhibitor of cysteine peptidase
MHLRKRKFKIFQSAIITICLLGLSGCSLTFRTKKAEPAPAPAKKQEVNQEDKTETQAGEKTLEAKLAAQSDIKKFKDYDELKAFLEKNQGSDNNSGYSGIGMGGAVMRETRTDAAPMMDGIAGSAPTAGMSESFGASEKTAASAQNQDYSKTNVQVEGVDEADIVKSDGEYIYTLSNNNLFIIKATPAKDAEIVSMIKFDSNPQNMYIKDNKLVVYGIDNSPLRSQEFQSRFRRWSQFSFLKVFDIKDKKNPKQVRNLDFEGMISETRLIGDYAYVVSNNSTYNFIDDLPLPRILEGGEAIPMACAETKCINPDVYYIDIPYGSYEFTSVSAVNVKDDNEKIGNNVYLISSSQNLFASESNIYLSYTKYLSEYEIGAEVVKELLYPKLNAKDQARVKEIESVENYVLTPQEKMNKVGAIIERHVNSLPAEEQDKLQKDIEEATKAKMKSLQEEMEKTVIHKIAINKGNLEYKARGEAKGHVLNQFSMDESGDYFRIATTRGRNWSQLMDQNEQESYSNVYVLDKEMKTVGRLENLAKGEQIYSARFMGKRAYLVTFKQMDPLFAIDLSDPSNPKVLGELKIPGFSDYLHPYDENTLIGIGKDTKDNQFGGVRQTGLKISLFDVRDVANPKEAAKIVLGESGSDSLALRDHKAVLFSKDKNLLVIPVTIREGNERNYWEQVAFTGAAVFTIKPDSIELKGKIDHKDAAFKTQYGWDYQYDTSVKRSLYIGDMLYTVSDKYLKANSLADLSEAKKLELKKEKKAGDDYEVVN